MVQIIVSKKLCKLQFSLRRKWDKFIEKNILRYGKKKLILLFPFYVFVFLLNLSSKFK